MSDQEYVKSLIKEAEVYRKQGLLNQAREIYHKVLKFIQNSKALGNRKDLADAVGTKIKNLEDSLADLHEESGAPELSEEVKGLIKDLFAFSKDKKAAAMEGALALAKFGQYESALVEFNKVLKAGILPLAAAKNIMRCNLALSSPNEAIDQYEHWMANDTLSKENLDAVRSFLGDLLQRKGLKVNLPSMKEAPPADDSMADRGGKGGDVLDISSVGVRLRDGSRKGKMVEFDVTFQSGNIISIVIASDQKDLVKAFDIGTVLPDMQFYSPIAIFKGKGIVSGKTQIKSGPKQGDYMLDIRVESG
jgi:tetratricopeptide (TPR) repeat protein